MGNLKKFLILLVCIHIFISCAPKCDFIPSSNYIPRWVVNQSNFDKKNYIGIGNALLTHHKSFPNMLEIARKRARAHLADSINLYISNKTIFKEQKSNDRYKYNFEFNSEQITNLYLKHFIKEEVWLDKNSCTLWVKVYIPKSKINNFLKQKENDLRILQEIKFKLFALENSAYLDKSSLKDIEELLRLFNKLDLNIVQQESENNPKDLYKRTLELRERIVNNEKAKKYTPFLIQLDNILNSEIDEITIKEFYKILDSINFDLLDLSDIPHNNRTFYLKKMYKKRLGKLKKEFNCFYKKVIDIKVNLGTRKRFLEMIKNLVNNSDFLFDKDKKLFERKIKKVEKYIDNPALQIPIGTSMKNIVKWFGKPDEIETPYFLFSSVLAYRYNNYWLIADDGHSVSCIIHQAGFKRTCGLAGCESRKCSWYIKYRKNFVIRPY